MLPCGWKKAQNKTISKEGEILFFYVSTCYCRQYLKSQLTMKPWKRIINTLQPHPWLCVHREIFLSQPHMAKLWLFVTGFCCLFFCRRSRVINENFAEFWAVVYWLRSRSDGDCHWKAKRLTEIPHRKWAWNSAVWLSCASIATKGSFKKLVFSALFDSEHKQRQKPCCHYGVFL